MSVRIIRLASDPSKVVASAVETPVNGSNVQIGTASTWRSAWNVNQVADGSWRIISTRAGKYADVKGGALSSGTNVQLYTGNNTRAQKWDIVDTGQTVEYGGVSYQVVNIAIEADPTLFMSQSGTNIVLGAATGFILTPLPVFESGGLYELRSMLDTTMAVDVAAGSLTKGANVQLYKANGSNAQKFYITDEGNGYSIRSIVSGMYVDVQGGSQVSGTNVQQYTDNDSRAQRWAVIQVGTTTVNDTECAVVSFGAFNATSFRMDVESALTTNKANVLIWQGAGRDGQLFALYPTTAEDKNMPSPSNVGIAELVGADQRSRLFSQTYVYPAWECPTAWASSGANHYEFRCSSRVISETGVWSPWSEFGEWSAAGVTQFGDRAWLTDGLEGTFDAKALQYQLQVRSVGVGETASVHSPAASAVVEVDVEATIDFTGMEWTLEGLEVFYETDYQYGTVDVYIESVTVDGEVLAEGFQTGYLDPSGSFVIPNSVIRAFPSDGSRADVLFSLSTDMYRSYELDGQLGVRVTVPDGGLDLTLTAGSVEGYGGLPVTSNVECDLVLVCDGRTHQLGRGTSWTVLFPYGPFEVRGYAQEGTRWGVDSLKYEAAPTEKRAHGWLLDGRVLSLETRESGAVEESRTLTAEYSNVSFAGRKRQAVFFGSVTVVNEPVSGLVIEDVTQADDDDFEALVGRRTLYRAPYGHIRKVAVTGLQADRTLGRTALTVSQDEVDQ